MYWNFWKKQACQALTSETPMDPNVKLYVEQGELFNPERYHYLVGSS